MKQKLITGIFGIFLSGVALASGVYGLHIPETQAQWLTSKVADKLQLNQIQQNKFRSLSQILLQIRSDMQQNKAAKHKELLTMLSQPTLQRDQIITRINHHINQIQSKTPELVNRFGDFYDSLTDAQRQTLRNELKKNFDNHRSQ